jgi:hypothetical protein
MPWADAWQLQLAPAQEQGKPAAGVTRARNLTQRPADGQQALPAPAEQAKLSPELRNADPESTVKVIVQFKDSPAEEQEQALQDKGGELRANLELIHSRVVSIPAGALTELARDEHIASIKQGRQSMLRLSGSLAGMVTGLWSV